MSFHGWVKGLSKWQAEKTEVQPFVSHSNVIDVEWNANHQPDDEETVRYDDISGRSEGHRDFHELHYDLRYLLLVAGKVEEHVRHPCTVGRCHLCLRPREPGAVPESHVDHK